MMSKKLNSDHFISERQIAAALQTEAINNSIQKRNGTNFPVTAAVAWSCGCCVSIRIKDEGPPILTPEQADEVLRLRKPRGKPKREPISMDQLKGYLAGMPCK